MPQPIIEEELVPDEVLANPGDFREIEPEFRAVKRTSEFYARTTPEQTRVLDRAVPSAKLLPS